MAIGGSCNGPLFLRASGASSGNKTTKKKKKKLRKRTSGPDGFSAWLTEGRLMRGISSLEIYIYIFTVNFQVPYICDARKPVSLEKRGTKKRLH